MYLELVDFNVHSGYPRSPARFVPANPPPPGRLLRDGKAADGLEIRKPQQSGTLCEWKGVQGWTCLFLGTVGVVGEYGFRGLLGGTGPDGIQF